MSTPTLQEVLPKAGLVYSEKSTLSEILSKPKIMPLKSITLEKLEEMEQWAKNVFADQRPETGSQRPQSSSGAVRTSSSSGTLTSSNTTGSSSSSSADHPPRPHSSAGNPRGLERGASVAHMGHANYGASGYGGAVAASTGSSTTATPGNSLSQQGAEQGQDDEEPEAPPPGTQGRRNSAPLERPPSASQALVRSASARPMSGKFRDQDPSDSADMPPPAE